MADTTDITAPYGRRVDGTPKAKPGRPPGSRTRNRNEPRTTSAARAGTGGSPYERVTVMDADPIDESPERTEFLAESDDGKDPRSSIDTDPQPRVSVSSVPRVTAAVRKDIAAKLALILGLPAALWATVDEFCGTAATECVTPFSLALADIVVDSPDLVHWFTSGGNYLKWLTAVTAIQPLGMMVARHHITHTVGDAGHEHATPRFDPQQYPAYPAAG